MAKPAAERAPGGAPLRATSKRPCKYGARVEGLCPKKPKAARATGSQGKKKPPCKYGPRDSEGYCPKKPKLSKTAQAGIDLVAPGRTPEQRAKAKQTLKSKAVSLGTKAAQQGAAAAAVDLHKNLLGTAKRREATKGKAIALGKKVAAGAGVAVRTVLPRVILGAAVLSLQGGGGADWPAARKWAKKEVAATKARLPKGQRLTKQQEQTLYQQFQAYHVQTIQGRKR